MTAAEIIRISLTVGITQCICDLLARRFVFSREPYQRSVSAFFRAKTKHDKVVSSVSTANSKSTKPSDKSAKKLQRAEDDLKEAAAEVAKRHTAPSFFTSMIFLILYRILSAEYSGKIVAVLPFKPWSLVKKITMRGLSFVDSSMGQTDNACAFLFIYILSTMSVKFIVHQLVGMHPPKGADKGVSTLLDAPRSQRVLQSFGVDTDEFNEARKAW